MQEFYKVRVSRDSESGVADIQAAGRTAGQQADVKAGDRIAVAVGSRGIADYAKVIRGVVAGLKDKGAEVFIVPAMGSHGGATAQSQESVLERLGICKESVGAAVVSGMETVEVGTFLDGRPLRMDRNAWDSDGVVIVNRVKAHTQFLGKIGSGIMKMTAIGLGKADGARDYHKLGRELGMERVIREAADAVIRTGKILGAVGIVENAVHRVETIQWLEAEQIAEGEERLFAHAMAFMPGLGVDRLDGLIVDQAGKEISGTGMDPYVIGRRAIGGLVEPIEGCVRIGAIYLRDLTAASGGNGLGVGLADLVHRRVVDKFDPKISAVNAMTSLNSAAVRMPVSFSSDREAMQAMTGFYTCLDDESARIMWVQNTALLERMLVSASVAEELREQAGFWVSDEPMAVEFDENGDVAGQNSQW